MSKAAAERKEKGKQVLNNRKTTNPISMIMDCLKFIIVATPCIGSIIYLVVNAEVDINTISMVVSVMSAIVMLSYRNDKGDSILCSGIQKTV